MDLSIGFLSNLLFQISIWAIPVLVAITMHEAAHAYVAWLCGDPTARDLGRVTLNPIPHIHPIGTIVLPILLIISSLGVIVGFAKPVPVNFARLRNPRRDMMLVAVAGPLANIVLLLVSAALLHVAALSPGWLGEWMTANLHRSMILNAILAVFNMMPIPPLDGGRIVTGLLPYSLAVHYAKLEKFGIFILIGGLFLLPMLASQVGIDLSFMNNILRVPFEFLLDTASSLVGLR